MSVVGFDTETYRFGPGDLTPKVVCASFWGPGETHVQGNGVADHIRPYVRAALRGGVVGANVAYDLACCAAAWPDLIPAIYDALHGERVHDISIRETLRLLGTGGNPEFEKGRKTDRSQAGLAKRHLDRVLGGKDGGGWRTRYDELDGKPAADYPEAAYVYALEDARAAYDVYQAQEKWAALFATESLHVFAAFQLYLSTAEGLLVDAERLAELEEHYLALLEPSCFPLLYEQGVIIPPEKPRPIVAVRHTKDCPHRGKMPRCACPRTPQRVHEEGCKKRACSCPPKLTKGDPDEHVRMAIVQARIVEVCERFGLPVKKTETGKVATGKEVLAELYGLDDLLASYRERAALVKLKTSYFPQLHWPPGLENPAAERVHPKYNALMKTSRVSSSGNRKGKPAYYPSVNIQQADPRIREVYVAPPGQVMVSCDFSSIDLVCFAQTLLGIYGESVLAEQINAGINPHTKLGSSLAYREVPEFRELLGSTLVDPFLGFLSLKPGTPEVLPTYTLRGKPASFFKYWRTGAKPIGLGFPGGLGPRTMVSFAAGYGMHLTIKKATEYREIWREEYPFAARYLKEWVPQQVYKRTTNAEGERRALHEYESPLGTRRRGCTYTQCANGNALQTPAAEGMKLAMCLVGEACHNPELESELLDCRIAANMHDELLVLIPDDERKHERAMEISRLMVAGQRIVTPDVRVEAEPVIMRRWDKNAEAVFDEAGRLTVWEEKGRD